MNTVGQSRNWNQEGLTAEIRFSGSPSAVEAFPGARSVHVTQGCSALLTAEARTTQCFSLPFFSASYAPLRFIWDVHLGWGFAVPWVFTSGCPSTYSAVDVVLGPGNGWKGLEQKKTKVTKPLLPWLPPVKYPMTYSMNAGPGASLGSPTSVFICVHRWL